MGGGDAMADVTRIAINPQAPSWTHVCWAASLKAVCQTQSYTQPWTAWSAAGANKNCSDDTST